MIRSTVGSSARACVLVASVVAMPALATGEAAPAVVPPTMYSVQFVAAAATGVAMNASGDVAGTSYIDTGCGPFCLPPQDTVVWRGVQRIVLPQVPGLTGIYVTGINAQGWVSGLAGFPGTATHAIVWKPTGNTYAAIDLGLLPGTTYSEAIGIDDAGRAVGWSGRHDLTGGTPFVWSESTGMLDLSAQGFPLDAPEAISPGGAVATVDTWYRLGDPTSIVLMPPAPQSFARGADSMSINDAGEQARFLVNIGPENLIYLFRFHHDDATWQMLSPSGSGHLSSAGVGSITSAGDVSATVLSTAVIAYGPDGTAQPLADLLSPAYQGGGSGAIVGGGPMNSSGQILARVMIGLEPRVVRLVPAAPCAARCIRVINLQMRGRFIPGPAGPGQCTLTSGENVVAVKAVVTSENGVRLGGVRIDGRFLDEYWTDRPVSAMTNAQGVASFTNRGICGVGTVSFLIDNATKGARTLDRTTGVLAADVIPAS